MEEGVGLQEGRGLQQRIRYSGILITHVAYLHSVDFVCCLSRSLATFESLKHVLVWFPNGKCLLISDRQEFREV